MNGNGISDSVNNVIYFNNYVTFFSRLFFTFALVIDCITNPIQMMTANSENNSVQKSTMESSQLMKLFEDGLKEVYWSKNALTKVIPQMIVNAKSEELIGVLVNQLRETEVQVARIGKIFESTGQKAEAKKCEKMEDLLEEAEEIMERSEPGSIRDAGIISAAKKIEYYEIVSYGTLRELAETLSLREAELLLQANLDEEKKTNKWLTEVAANMINVEMLLEEV